MDLGSEQRVLKRSKYNVAKLRHGSCFHHSRYMPVVTKRTVTFAKKKGNICVCIPKINGKKKVINLKKSKEGYIGGGRV